MAGITFIMTAENPIKMHGIMRRLSEIENTQMVAQSENTVNGTGIVTVIFERYYFRTRGYSSAVITLLKQEASMTASISVTNGSNSAFNLSLGANRAFAKEIIKVMNNCGFTQYADV